ELAALRARVGLARRLLAPVVVPVLRVGFLAVVDEAPAAHLPGRHPALPGRPAVGRISRPPPGPRSLAAGPRTSAATAPASGAPTGDGDGSLAPRRAPPGNAAPPPAGSTRGRAPARSAGGRAPARGARAAATGRWGRRTPASSGAGPARAARRASPAS